jgi:transcriptional regulator with XRE-family HTH domain
VTAAELLSDARRQAGLSQHALAQRAGTSRERVSAYEHGHTSPTVATAERLLAVTGHHLVAEPRIEFVRRDTGRGRTVAVPIQLPRLPADQALATVALPVHLNWTQPGRTFHLANRSERARVYEAVLTEGGPEDVLQYVDGVLLVDLWDEMVLPRGVRQAWEPLIEAAREPAAS